jgi:hypothetical protein
MEAIRKAQRLLFWHHSWEHAYRYLHYQHL